MLPAQGHAFSPLPHLCSSSSSRFWPPCFLFLLSSVGLALVEPFVFAWRLKKGLNAALGCYHCASVFCSLEDIPFSLFPPKDGGFYVSLQMASWSAVALQLYDILTQLDLEVKHIWPLKVTSWIKWTFLLVRYHPLAIQLLYRVFEFRLSVLGKYSRSTLAVLWLIQPLQILIPAVAIEIVMMVRVYALFDKKKKVLWTCIFLIFQELVSIVGGMILYAPDLRTMQPLDFATKFPPTTRWFGSTSALTEAVILLMTVLCRSRFRSVPIFQLLFRDGVFIIALMTLFSCVMIVYTSIDWPFDAPVFSWNLTLFSCAGTRLILNFQAFYRPSSDVDLSDTTNGESYHLTTIHPGLTMHPANLENDIETDLNRSSSSVHGGRPQIS
ncbi:hypothetical protein DL96DRAFT_1601267 [Flagelloscypha sp. PMI_526]|nr:hypothetical protein DL96DRAFT_1601267 [Flagelloscypha sp. PMI_526]